MMKAVAVIDQTSDDDSQTSDAHGTVTFSQKENEMLTHVQGSIHCLKPGAHALIVHEFGDTRMDWMSTGRPFKPAGNDGLIENIVANHHGTANFDVWSKVPLSGKESVIGRGLVAHKNPGPDAGPGVVWCVVGLEG